MVALVLPAGGCALDVMPGLWDDASREHGMVQLVNASTAPQDLQSGDLVAWVGAGVGGTLTCRGCGAVETPRVASAAERARLQGVWVAEAGAVAVLRVVRGGPCER